MAEVDGRTFDWTPNPDLRNFHFLTADLDCYNNGSARGSARRRKSTWLDQGREGACTGFGTAHVLNSTPYAWEPFITETGARALYHEARRQDEWPGEEYEGSSVNGAMKAARYQGYITEWRWCLTLAEVRHALSYHGPLVLGTYWYEGMWEPTADGFLHVTGQVIGGHALAVSGYDRYSNFRLENSWGRDWGEEGGAWLRPEDLTRLLADGEAAVPKKVRR